MQPSVRAGVLDFEVPILIDVDGHMLPLVHSDLDVTVYGQGVDDEPANKEDFSIGICCVSNCGAWIPNSEAIYIGQEQLGPCRSLVPKDLRCADDVHVR